MPYYGLYIPAKAGDAIKSNANENGNNSGNNNTTNGATLSPNVSNLKNGFNNVNAGHTPKLVSAANAECKSPFVFNEKKEALDKLKQHKDARLREFDTEPDAVNYAETGFEVVTNRYPIDKNVSTVSETNSQFRGPTRQELVIFRKLIEQGDVKKVKDQIWDNPRYLVGYGDTPTTLREGARYNAMHICSIYKQPKVAELILKTVSDTKFVELLVGKKDDKMSTEFCRNLLDYYLNITEKGRNETPLHLASKLGCVEMVELLTSYPQCKRTPNSDNLYPEHVICSRQNNPDEVTKTRIGNLLGERFYVPVLCSTDNTIPPHIGQPFSQNKPPDLKSDILSPDVKIQALAGPMDSETAEKFRRRWKTPPRVGSEKSASPLNNCSFISPVKVNLRINNSTPRSTERNSSTDYSRSIFQQRRLIFNNLSEQGDTLDSAVMDRKNGNHTALKTEKENKANDENNLNNNYMDPRKRSMFLNYRDPNPASPLNPVETPQKKVYNHNHGLMSQLNLFSPIASERDSSFFCDETKSITSASSFALSNSMHMEAGDGLDAGFKERHIKITDPEKGLECIGRELACKEFCVDWREYWDFLDAFIDIREKEGLQLLESYFVKRIESETNLPKVNTALDQVFNALEQITNGPAWNKSTATVKIDEPYPQAKSKPYLVVEKSLQVYAKRIAKVFLCNHHDGKTLSYLLMFELKRLKSLISSFKEDQRFQLVDVSKVHARIARLVHLFVADDIKDAIANVLRESYTGVERSDYYKCFCEMFLLIFNSYSTTSYALHMHNKEEVCQKDWESENSCKCDWDFSLSRKTSRRHRYKSGQYSSAKDTNVQSKDNVDNAQKTDLDQLATDMKDRMKIETEGNMLEVESEENDEYYDCFESDESFADDFDSDSNDDLFFTPIQNRSTNDLLELEDDVNDKSTKLFIYSDIPTKRDVDVLNAIADVELDAKIYPNIVAWKSAVLKYSKEEMTEFPTPTIVKKTHVPNLQNRTLNDLLGAPLSPKNTNINSTRAAVPLINNEIIEQQHKLPIRKRLLMSPTLKIANVL